MQLTVLKEFPAYKLVEPTADRLLMDGEKIALPYRSSTGRDLYHFFIAGSVVGFALRYGQCPEKALAQARERGHELWYLVTCATVLHDVAIKQTTHKLFDWGSEVTFHGRRFRIDPATNKNAKLALIGEITK